MARISQREARRLKKDNEQLRSVIDNQKRRWSSEWPGGSHLGSIDLSGYSILYGRVDAARLLKHAVVVTVDSSGTKICFHALQLPEAAV